MLKNISRRSLVLIALDILAITFAYGFGVYLRTGGLDLWWSHKFFLIYLFYQAVLVLLFYIFDLYYPFKLFQKMATLIDIGMSVVIGMVIAGAAAYADRSLILPRLIFVYTSLCLIPLVFLGRLFYDFIFASRFLNQRTLVLGSGPLAQQIVEMIQKTPHSGMELIGLITEKQEIHRKNIKGVPVIGDLTRLVSLIDWYGIRLVVLALDAKEEMSEAEILAQLFARDVTVTSSIHLFEKLTGDVPYQLFGGHYILGLISNVKTRPYLKLKRVMDIVIGIILGVITLPILLVAMFILSFEGPKQIFFVQERVGRSGHLFHLIKLRSMRLSKKGKPVVTSFGKFIRKFRIDEIPQLMNVIKGDMSLVGPRPEISYFANKCRKGIPFYDAVYTVKPGLTGWAQVNFRYTKTLKGYDQKFRYNLFYLKNISLTLDLIILLRTIRIVLLGKGQ